MAVDIHPVSLERLKMVDTWAFAAVMIFLGSIIYPFIKKLSASLSITIGLVLIFMLEMVSSAVISRSPGIEDFPYNLAFSPLYLSSGDSLYTLVTSIFIHADFLHIIFNALWLVFLGMMLEERISTSKYIAIFLISGIAGNLVYGIANFGSYSIAVGASGAIFGIMGAILVLFPREKMTFIIYFIPLRNMPVWLMVLIFLTIQLFLALSPASRIAWQAHIGGLAAGILLTPVMMRLGSEKRFELAENIDIEKFATTKNQKELLSRIRSESIPEVRKAWLEEFVKTLKCPICQANMRVHGNGFKCRNNHKFRISRRE